MRLSRWLSALAQLSRLAVLKPRAFLSAGHRGVRTMLDFAFDHASPIPVLPPHLAGRLGEWPVILPPANLLTAGNQLPTGLALLVSLARAIGARSIFEIGTYNGVTALTLARNLPEAIVYTLDLPAATQPQLPVFRVDPLYFSNFAQRAYEGQPEEARVVQLLGDSARFDFSPYRKRCQLVYIDGAHSYDYVQNDTKAAFTLVDEVAAIAWDDYGRFFPGIARFLHTLGKQRDLFRLPNSRLVVWLSDSALRCLKH